MFCFGRQRKPNSANGYHYATVFCIERNYKRQCLGLFCRQQRPYSNVGLRRHRAVLLQLEYLTRFNKRYGEPIERWVLQRFDYGCKRLYHLPNCNRKSTDCCPGPYGYHRQPHRIWVEQWLCNGIGIWRRCSLPGFLEYNACSKRSHRQYLGGGYVRGHSSGYRRLRPHPTGCFDPTCLAASQHHPIPKCGVFPIQYRQCNRSSNGRRGALPLCMEHGSAKSGPIRQQFGSRRIQRNRPGHQQQQHRTAGNHYRSVCCAASECSGHQHHRRGQQQRIDSSRSYRRTHSVQLRVEHHSSAIRSYRNQLECRNVPSGGNRRQRLHG